MSRESILWILLVEFHDNLVLLLNNIAPSHRQEAGFENIGAFDFFRLDHAEPNLPHFRELAAPDFLLVSL